MFITLTKKLIILFFLVGVVLFSVAATAVIAFENKTKTTGTIPAKKNIVVIDAGHGGLDGGSSGRTTKVKESELNLAYALNLSRQLQQMGIGVVLTRSGENALYDPNASNKKRSDMQAREKIINNSGADLVVSLHMNTFPLSSCYGAQAFFRKNNSNGKKLADCVQTQFVSLLDSPKKHALSGDYYIVNCTDLPAIIVECGYLSNPTEERLLQTKDYQNKVCYAIVCGILEFL